MERLHKLSTDCIGPFEDTLEHYAEIQSFPVEAVVESESIARESVSKICPVVDVYHTVIVNIHITDITRTELRSVDCGRDGSRLYLLISREESGDLISVIRVQRKTFLYDYGNTVI